MNKISAWEIHLGFYPGILLGFRSYQTEEVDNHVFYLPFIDICVTVYREKIDE